MWKIIHFIFEKGSLILEQDGTETRKTFLHVLSAIEAEEAGEIGVEHILRDIKDSTTTTLATRVAEQLSSLRGLQSRVSDIQKYLVEVAARTILYHLQDVLNLLQQLSMYLRVLILLAYISDLFSAAVHLSLATLSCIQPGGAFDVFL